MKVTPFSGHFCLLTSRDEHINVRLLGEDVTSVRGIPTIKLLLDLVEISDLRSFLKNSKILVQFSDMAEYPIRSVAFCRRSDMRSKIDLIVDTYFHGSLGYANLRSHVLQGVDSRWSDRSSAVFWRGSSTFDYEKLMGGFVESIYEVPRVDLCHRFGRNTRCDFGISSVWGEGFLGPGIHNELLDLGVVKNGTPSMREWAKFKFCIDIDGVASAWGLLEKMILGICVLKVESIYEQWFYSELIPWENFIPVKSDLSNLEEIIEWCLKNDNEAEKIAKNGQLLAFRQTYEHSMNHSVKSILRSSENN